MSVENDHAMARFLGEGRGGGSDAGARDNRAEEEKADAGEHGGTGQGATSMITRW